MALHKKQGYEETMARKVKEKPEGYITTSEASVLLNTSTTKIVRLRREGILEGYKDGHFAYISLASTEKVKASGLLVMMNHKGVEGCPYAGKGCEEYKAELCDSCPLPECRVSPNQAQKMKGMDKRRREAEEKDWKYKHIRKEDLPPDNMAHVLLKQTNRRKLT